MPGLPKISVTPAPVTPAYMLAPTRIRVVRANPSSNGKFGQVCGGSAVIGAEISVRESANPYFVILAADDALSF